jgi:hypothetical protein
MQSLAAGSPLKADASFISTARLFYGETKDDLKIAGETALAGFGGYKVDLGEQI